MNRLNLFHCLQLYTQVCVFVCLLHEPAPSLREGQVTRGETPRWAKNCLHAGVSQSSHKFVLPPLLVAGTKDLVGLFIQPNVEDLTGGQYVGKDK